MGLEIALVLIVDIFEIEMWYMHTFLRRDILIRIDTRNLIFNEFNLLRLWIRWVIKGQFYICRLSLLGFVLLSARLIGVSLVTFLA